MLAPERFARWMTKHVHRNDYGEFRYHPRSDAHSKELTRYVLEDLLDRSSVLREQAARGEVVYGINLRYTWTAIEKTKTLDLAIGIPVDPPELGGEPIATGPVAEVLFSCEAKSCMTEHGKSKPRLFDELSSSHEIVHRGRADAIATGITVVNIASEFVSPLRQRVGQPIEVTIHDQPRAAAGMIKHLKGLKFRDEARGVGFDAYSTLVVDCDNRGPASLWTDPPAPQPGEKDHYETFLERIGRFWDERFSDLPPR